MVDHQTAIQSTVGPLKAVRSMVALTDGWALMVESMVGWVKMADLQKADSWMEIARPKDGSLHYHG